MDDAQRQDFRFARNIARDENNGAVFAEAARESHGEACENRRLQRRKDDASERVDTRCPKAGGGFLFGYVKIFDDRLQRADYERNTDKNKRDEYTVDAVGDFDAQRLQAGSNPTARTVEAADGDAGDSGRKREGKVDPKFQELASRELVSRKRPCHGESDNRVEEGREEGLSKTDLKGGDGFGRRENAAEFLWRQLCRPNGESGHRQQDQQANVGHADTEH